MNIPDSMGTMSSYVNVNVFTKTTSTLWRLLFSVGQLKAAHLRRLVVRRDDESSKQLNDSDPKKRLEQ
jgi:hypothetical protein